METASILVPARDSDDVIGALRREQLLDGDTELHNGLVYFRLPPPEKVAFADELEQLTGQLEPEPGDLWVTHPFECWIAGPLTLSGERVRDHVVLPAKVIDSTGDVVDATGIEVRTQPANAPYLLLALAKAGLTANAKPVVRILD